MTTPEMIIKKLKQQINDLNEEFVEKIDEYEDIISRYEDKISQYEDKISQYEDKISKYENGEKIKELEEQLILKDNVITQLNNEIKTYKTNNKTNDSNPELMNKIRSQNQVIKKLVLRLKGVQDQVILNEQFERDLDSYSKNPITSTGGNNYTSKVQIPDYQYWYNKIYEQIITPNDKRYPNSGLRLNITNYKRWTDYDNKKDKKMKFLDELGITLNESSHKYDMTKVQVDALIEKVVIYFKNEGRNKQ